MKINTPTQPYALQRNGVLSPKPLQKSIKDVELSEEQWRKISEAFYHPKPAEPVIQKKSMVQSVVDTIKNMWPKPKPFKLSDHDKDFSVSIDA
jgi:hypothetical protein